MGGMSVNSVEQLEAMVDVSCAVITRFGVREVALVINQGLTAAEYQRLRERALASRVNLWLSSDGCLQLRPGIAAVGYHHHAPAERRSWLDRLRRHVPHASLPSINGGVR